MASNKKDIEGYEDLYEIYEDGRVFGKKCKKFLKHLIGSNGYYYVSLSKNGKVTNAFIHRLIAIHFIPNPLNKPCIDHKDKIRTNNSISNLQWCTNQENDWNRSVKSNKKNGGKYIGVDWKEPNNKWLVHFKFDGKYEHIGMFDDQDEGNEARKEYIKKNHPEKYNHCYPI